MAETEWYVLCVDDEEDRAVEVRDYLDGEQVGESDILRVEVQTSFEEGLRALERGHFDIVILDVRQGDQRLGAGDDEAGRRLLAEIRRRRFLPVVFYTGLPGAVADLRSSLIRVVEKTSGLDRLENEVRDVFRGGLPAVNRALRLGLEQVQRDYLWSEGDGWQADAAKQNSGELIYVLSRRLAATLTGPMIADLARAVGAPVPSSGDHRHPVQLYIAPPVTADPHPGEIVQRTSEDSAQEYLIVLTPACDIVQQKAEYVLLARCTRLEEQEEYLKWAELPNPSNTAMKSLEQLLRNNRSKERERYYYLPRAFDVPDLVVDFQQLESIKLGELNAYSRLAALDAPFAQSLLAQFVRYFGRVGTPDLDIRFVMDRLSNERNR